jgi:hypothetical protein
MYVLYAPRIISCDIHRHSTVDRRSVGDGRRDLRSAHRQSYETARHRDDVTLPLPWVACLD